MKKLVSVIVIALLCALALCACTPGKDNLITKFINRGYGIGLNTPTELSNRGADLEQVDYQFVARNNLSVAHVVAFKDGESAKSCYEKVQAYVKTTQTIDGLKWVAKKKGNAVVWGTADAVKLI